MQISQTFNIIFFFSIVLPHHFYHHFTNTLPGTILHICLTLIFRLSVKCLYNIFDIYTSNYWKRNSIVLIIISFYWGYKYHSAFQKVIFSKVYPTLKTLIFTVLLYIVEIYYPVLNWCTDVTGKYKAKLFSTIREIVQNRIVLKSLKIIKYEKILDQNLYGTIIVILYIISICESHNKMQLFSMQMGELSPKVDLFTLTGKTNSNLLLRTLNILSLILTKMNKLP